MPSIHILEPHPSVPKRNAHYLSSGIGGAGNHHTYHPSVFTHGPEASGPAFAPRNKLPPPSILTSSTTTSSHDPHKPAKMRMTGRGGAGNARPTTIHQPFDLEADLARAEQREAQREERRRLSLAPVVSARRNSSVVYHVGRGGAGNAFDEDEEVARFRREAGRMGDDGSLRSMGSVSTQGSVGRWGRRMSRLLSRGD